MSERHTHIIVKSKCITNEVDDEINNVRNAVIYENDFDFRRRLNMFVSPHKSIIFVQSSYSSTGGFTF